MGVKECGIQVSGRRTKNCTRSDGVGDAQRRRFCMQAVQHAALEGVRVLLAVQSVKV